MRRLLLLVGAIVFVDTIFFAALTPLLPHYADALSLSKTEAGVLSAAYPAGTLLAAIPSGVFVARVGVKPAALIGLGVLVATTIVFGLVRNYWLLDAARFAQGFASAFSWTAGLAWLTSAAPPSRRGELIGTALGAAIVGALFGPVVGGIASLTGTGPAFGGVALLATVVAGFALRTAAPQPAPPQPPRELLAALLDVRILAAAWFVLVPAMLFGTLSVLGPLRLDDLGFGAVAIGATWLVSAGCEAVVSPLMGRISDRRGRLAPLRAALVGSAAVAAVLPWLDHAWLLAGFVVVGATVFGIFWTPALSLLADSTEARGLDYAYGFALTNIAWAPGQLGGAALGGAIADASSDAVPYLAGAAICLFTLALIQRRPAAAALPAWRSESSS